MCFRMFTTSFPAPRVDEWCVQVCFIARYMPLTDIRDASRYPPPLTRPVPYAKITGVFWAILTTSTLSAADARVHSSVR